MGLRIVFLAVLLCAVLNSRVLADELPLWEAGLGATGLSMPDYRGSDEQRGYLFPIPYIVYRGDILRLDRKGIYGLLFESERVELNISADANVPVKSDRNTARTGMPDLNATIQIGPSIEVCLYKSCNADRVIQFRLPLRAVIASDLSRASGAGFVANPQLNFDFKKMGSGRGWNFGFALGPVFATTQYHRYYYSVPQAYEIPGDRAAYDARGGFSGTSLVVALSKRFQHTWFAAFGRYDDLSGAVFRDSPLVRTRHAYIAGIGFAWVFGESSALVHASQ
jgi:MipA family protein